jgi:hypothetical protein
MSLWCALGRHRWVTRQEVGESGRVEDYQQCARCGHYPMTSNWTQRDPDRWEPHPPGFSSDSGGGGGAAGV